MTYLFNTNIKQEEAYRNVRFFLFTTICLNLRLYILENNHYICLESNQ